MDDVETMRELAFMVALAGCPTLMGDFIVLSMVTIVLGSAPGDLDVDVVVTRVAPILTKPRSDGAADSTVGGFGPSCNRCLSCSPQREAEPA